MTEREIRFTDRYGASIEGDISVEALGVLLDSIAVPDGDDEHASISVSDSDEWNIEYYRDSVLFENVDVDGGPVGELRGVSREERLAIGGEFIAGDFEALRARPWAA
jgi:hypothetical protein